MDNARGAWDLSRVVRLLMFAMLLALVGAVQFAARTAWADTQAPLPDAPVPDARAEAELVFQRAEREDEAMRFAEALAAYERVKTIDPGSRHAPRADARAATLRGHREGDFVPFTKLEQLRRSPPRSSDPNAVDALVADAAAFPPGPTRIEVWVLAAEAYTNRFERPADAMRLLRLVIDDEHTDPVVRTKAVRDLATLEVARGDLGAAKRTAKDAGASADPKLAKELTRMSRRRWVHAASIAVVVFMIALAARALFAARHTARAAAAGAATKKILTLAVLYGVYVAVSGALLASGYESGTGVPFLVLGVAIVPIVLLARAWSVAGSAARPARATRAAVCAAGALGAAFLVLERVNASFLDGMGL